MKHLFTYLLVAISATSFAQGNLQFNQVLNFNYSATIGLYASSNVATVTVPTGKVWKITSASSERQNELTSSAIKVDNHVLYKDKTQAMSLNTPYWLQAGTHTITLSNLYGGTSTIHGSISAIEFNVVP